MKMKKLLAINLILAGLFLTSCGNKADIIETGDTVATENTLAKENSEKIGTGKAEEETAKDAEIEDAEEIEDSSTPRILQLNKDSKIVTYVDQESYEPYIKYNDEVIILTDEEAENYPALAKSLREKLEERNNTYQNELTSFIEAYEEEKEYGFTPGYEMNTKASIARADSTVLSICNFYNDYYGGAHGMYGYFGYNYDPKTGKELKFSDVVAKPVEFLMLANDKIQEGYTDEFEIPSSLEEFCENYDTSIMWTIDYQGVNLYFNPYTLGSFAMGLVETKVYFSEAPELFNPKYLNIPESYVLELKKGDDSYIDINNDGKSEIITILSNYDDEYYYITDTDVKVGGNTFNFYGEPEHCYYVSDKGKNYIFVFYSYEGGYWLISSIDLSTMEMDPDNDTEGFLTIYDSEWIDEDNRSESNNIEAVFTDPNKVMLSKTLQYLGTMNGKDYYHMGDESHLIPDTGIYSIDSGTILTANVDIDCDQVDIDGNVTGKATITEGMKLVVRRGDEKTFADLIEVPADAEVEKYEYYEYLESEFNLEDAAVIYRVYGQIDADNYMAYINGQEEYLVFSNIMYAD